MHGFSVLKYCFQASFASNDNEISTRLWVLPQDFLFNSARRFSANIPPSEDKGRPHETHNGLVCQRFSLQCINGTGLRLHPNCCGLTPLEPPPLPPPRVNERRRDCIVAAICWYSTEGEILARLLDSPFTSGCVDSKKIGTDRNH